MARPMSRCSVSAADCADAADTDQAAEAPLALGEARETGARAAPPVFGYPLVAEEFFPMITKVTIENFKRFDRQEFELDSTIVLAGPNNSGKSTLLQALATWSMALERWNLGKGKAPGAKIRTGQALTRKDFTALPLREFNLLWHKTLTALSRAEITAGQKPGEPRLIHITVEGTAGLSRGDSWALTMELRYQSTEQVYVKPITPDNRGIPPEAANLMIVHCPPFSGIGAEEKRMDRGAQQLEVGRGKPGDVLRNLLLEVRQDKHHWNTLVHDIQNLFGLTLEEPQYDVALPFIRCEYLDGVPKSGKGKSGLARYDIASGGSGFHQVLLLLCFFYARPASVLLLDEPDAHLHVILQNQVYDTLRAVAARRACQLIVATHSEVILDATPPDRVVSFLGQPHRLVRADQRDQVREAMARLTTLDLLLAEQGRAVLYCEGPSDLNILREWARVLDHPARHFLQAPFFHSNGGRNPREAKAHLFALRAIRPGITGLLLLDGNNRQIEDHELSADGLTILRWKRYEIENYLLVPEAIRRFLAAPDTADIFAVNRAERAEQYLKTQFAESFFANPLSDDTQAVVEVPASKRLLPTLFAAAGQDLDKSDFYQLAAVMQPSEIHPDAIRVLEVIAALLPPRDAED